MPLSNRAAPKASVKHGDFGPLIEAEFGITEVHARRLMRVAERFGTKTNIMFDLPDTVQMLLAAPKSDIMPLLPDTVQLLLSAPDNVKSGVSDKVEAQIEAGEVKPTAQAAPMSKGAATIGACKDWCRDKRENYGSVRAQLTYAEKGRERVNHVNTAASSEGGSLPAPDADPLGSRRRPLAPIGEMFLRDPELVPRQGPELQQRIERDKSRHGQQNQTCG